MSQQMHQHQHATAPRTVRPAPPPRSLALDLYRGVIWGDFDRDLGAAGATAQALVGFIPAVGTLTALRDLLACIGQRDPLGIVLNILAAFPVLGGFAKIADALHTVHRYQRAAQRRKQRTLAGAASPSQAPIARRNGWASFGLSLLVTTFAALYGLGVRLLFAYLWAHGPTIQGYAVRGSGAWLAPLLLLPLGLALGFAVTVRRRLWLGLTLLTFALALGFMLTGLPYVT
jgi:hypothetical protein